MFFLNALLSQVHLSSAFLLVHNWGGKVKFWIQRLSSLCLFPSPVSVCQQVEAVLLCTMRPR